MSRLLQEATGAISRLTEVELVSAFSRRHREGSLSALVLRNLIEAVGDEVSTVSVVELTSAVVAQAQKLLLRHPLRASDAVQLASCLVLAERLRQPVEFLAFDDRLNSAALQEGLPAPASA